MALRTPAERAARLREWLADPRNAGRQPPIDVLPPGLAAPRRASREQVALVEEQLEHHRRELAGLTRAQMQALLPAFDRAERELGQALGDWIGQTPDGELRWTAQSYRAALVQVHEGALFLRKALGEQLEEGAAKAQRLAFRHLKQDLARFTEVFEGTLPSVRVHEAALVANGRSFLAARSRTAAARYAGFVPGSRDSYLRDIRKSLIGDIYRGAKVRETVDRLVEQGGPRGLVALRGVKGEEGALVELIPEGLFVRYRGWAERLVRTEMSSAYGVSMADGLDQLAADDPEFQKRWMVAPGCCLHICYGLDGQVVPVNGTFDTPIGTVEHNPAHPNCKCTICVWKTNWGALPLLRDRAAA